MQADDVQRARILAKRTIESVLAADEPVVVALSENELNGLVAMASRGVPELTGRINVTEWGLEGALSYRLPDNPLARFVNLRGGLEASSHGIYINRLALGRIEVPGPLALRTARTAADILLGDDQGTLLLAAVEKVTLDQGRVRFHINPPSHLKRRLERIRDRLKDVRDDLALLGDPESVRAYYVKMIDIARELESRDRVSLAAYLGPLFELARARSKSSDPAIENQALIIALTIFLGDPRIEKLVGEVVTEDLRKIKSKVHHVSLANRVDLRLHFIVSAGLKVVSDRGLSHAIGELKELLDSDAKGSGFSFPDLAADRAGVRFAELATNGESGDAWRIQTMFSGRVEESDIFPAIDGLDEGLSEAEFERKYGGVDSDRYQRIVDEIDARIDRVYDSTRR